MATKIAVITKALKNLPSLIPGSGVISGLFKGGKLSLGLVTKILSAAITPALFAAKNLVPGGNTILTMKNRKRQRETRQKLNHMKRNQKRLEKAIKSGKFGKGGSGKSSAKKGDACFSSGGDEFLINPLSIENITVTQMVAGDTKQDIQFAQRVSKKNTKLLGKLEESAKIIAKNSKSKKVKSKKNDACYLSGNDANGTLKEMIKNTEFQLEKVTADGQIIGTIWDYLSSGLLSLVTKGGVFMLLAYATYKLFMYVKDNFTEVMGKIGEWLKDALGLSGDWLGDLIDKAIDWGIDEFKKKAKDWWEKGKEAIAKGVEEIPGSVRKAEEWLKKNDPVVKEAIQIVNELMEVKKKLAKGTPK